MDRIDVVSLSGSDWGLAVKAFSVFDFLLKCFPFLFLSAFL
jgi:hypothetical protein